MSLPQFYYSLKNILAKIDVQGFEDKVIDGSRECLSSCKVVIIEMSYYELYIKQLLFDDIYKKLKLLGFNYHGNWNQSIDPSDGKILYSDSIFIR